MTIVKIDDQVQFYNSIEILERLETRNYTLELSRSGFYLKESEPFQLPTTVYSHDDFLINTVLKSYRAGPGNLGVMLHGEKGSGKSVTAKILAKKSGLPTVIIKSKINEDFDYIEFLRQIPCDYCLMVDEFDKVFEDSDNAKSDVPHHTSNSILSYMDGGLTTKSKVLFVFTSNREPTNLLSNRPSRIRFSKSYSGVSQDILNGIIQDRLEDKSFEQDLRANIDENFISIDSITSIIDDINILKAPYSSFMNIYNLKSGSFYYVVGYSVIEKDEDIDDDDEEDTRIIREFNGAKWVCSVGEYQRRFSPRESVVMKTSKFHIERKGTRRWLYIPISPKDVERLYYNEEKIIDHTLRQIES